MTPTLTDGNADVTATNETESSTRLRPQREVLVEVPSGERKTGEA